MIDTTIEKVKSTMDRPRPLKYATAMVDEIPGTVESVSTLVEVRTVRTSKIEGTLEMRYSPRDISRLGSTKTD